MPRRFNYEDDDDYRLPSGVKRIGYDADTQQYIFQQGNKTFRGSTGTEYGPFKASDQDTIRVEPVIHFEPDELKSLLTLDPPREKKKTGLSGLFKTVTTSIIHARRLNPGAPPSSDPPTAESVPDIRAPASNPLPPSISIELENNTVISSTGEEITANSSVLPTESPNIQSKEPSIIPANSLLPLQSLPSIDPPPYESVPLYPDLTTVAISESCSVAETSPIGSTIQ